MPDTTTTLTQTDISKAVSNAEYGHFTLKNDKTGETRVFEIRDLAYDDYIEFCDLARPIIASVTAGFNITTTADGEVGLAFNPMGLDFEQIIRACGKELPRMAYICCRQSDHKITEKDVKRLARRPHKLLEIVLLQIKQNEIIKEFQDFFPQLASLLTDLAPQAKEALSSVPVPTTTE